ncbi:MAG TPA: DUF4476 domain-containing protein [Chitinophagaceae bacterium]|nr:DUF4476 domain-containing protein [Chitinophagaceae bacterium]
MKHWMLSLLMVFGTALAFGQQEYFIYLQTDNHQPFYVRLNIKVYSSTESGYLIIPRLSDSTYQLVVGFPRNLFPEQTFSTPVNHKDAGYLVKDFGDKGWGLFNLLTMAVIPASNAPVEKKSPDVNVTKKTDAFSTLLANAVNDTSILYVTSYPVRPAAPVVKRQVSKDTATTIAPAEEKQDTAAVAKTEPLKTDSAVVVKKEPVQRIDTLRPDSVSLAAASDPIKSAVVPAPSTPEQKTVTNKVAELLTDTSYIAVFTDGTTEKFDTIRISIPLDKPGIQMAEAKASGKTPVYNMPGTGQQKDSIELAQQTKAPEQKPLPPAKDTVKAVAIDSMQVHEKPKKEVTAAIDNTTRPADTARRPVQQPDIHQADTLHTEVAAKPVIIPNSTCKNIAWDSDIDKLRVKMMAVKNDDDKIGVAKKFFKQKCLTVKQVKALSELFVTDEGKYKWFDAAYPSVSDVADFRQLGDLIKDNYYQSRFKAMIRK